MEMPAPTEVYVSSSTAINIMGMVAKAPMGGMMLVQDAAMCSVLSVLHETVRLFLTCVERLRRTFTVG